MGICQNIIDNEFFGCYDDSANNKHLIKYLSNKGEPMKSNLKIIAEELGVSIVAVSNALNDKAGVSDELRKAVKASALRNGYDKTVLRTELERRTRNIAVIISRRQLNPV